MLGWGLKRSVRELLFESSRDAREGHTLIEHIS